MTDERFDSDLRRVLREMAGREAPGSLRDRIAQMVDEAPTSRRVWFASPLRLSFAAVAAVAVLALVIIFGPSRLIGPSPSESPRPSATPVSPTAGPSSATPTSTPQPIPVWSGLNWSSGLGIRNGDGYAIVNDALEWGNGYVGVGEFRGADGQTVSSAFFASADGTHWTMVQKEAPSQSVQDEGPQPRHVEATSAGLLAVTNSPFGGGVPTLWRSIDGRTWTLVNSPTWRAAWDSNANGAGHIITIAAHGDSIIALGGQGPGCCASPDKGPILVTSSDGQTWHRLDLSSAFDHAHVLALTAFADGFAMVGYTGDYHFDLDMNLVGVSRPAAWTSADGLAWRQSSIEGDAGAAVQLSNVVAGADGLFAVGRRAGAPAATLVGDGVGATSGWASADGRTWRLVGDLGKELPDVVRMAGDGTRMVILGRTSCKATDLIGWVSTDGATWSRLASSGSPPSHAIPGPICQDDGTDGWNDGGSYLALTWVVPEGVLITTTGPTAGETIWFGAAVNR